MIIGLPFIKATGMILDFIDNVAECKHLDCPPFPMDFRHTSNHVPVAEAPAHHLGPHETSVLKELLNLEHWYNAKVMAGSSSGQNLAVYFGFKLRKRAYIPDLDSIITVKSPNSILNNSWVPQAPSLQTIHLMITTSRFLGRMGICKCVPHLRRVTHQRTDQQVTRLSQWCCVTHWW
jgi:hypothetical protein